MTEQINMEYKQWYNNMVNDKVNNKSVYKCIIDCVVEYFLEKCIKEKDQVLFDKEQLHVVFEQLYKTGEYNTNDTLLDAFMKILMRVQLDLYYDQNKLYTCITPFMLNNYLMENYEKIHKYIEKSVRTYENEL